MKTPSHNVTPFRRCPRARPGDATGPDDVAVPDDVPAPDDDAAGGDVIRWRDDRSLSPCFTTSIGLHVEGSKERKERRFEKQHVKISNQILHTISFIIGLLPPGRDNMCARVFPSSFLPSSPSSFLPSSPSFLITFTGDVLFEI